MFKNLKQEDYINLFKKFMSIDYYTILDEINSFLGKEFKDLNDIQFFINQIIEKIQAHFTHYIINKNNMDLNIKNFIENGFNVSKW